MKKENIQSFPQMTSFFIPLALQAISQSFTYPLVAMVAARGEGSYMNIAALAQSWAVTFFIFNFGAGLIATGMVFIKNRVSYIRYKQANLIFMAITFLFHLFCCVPAVSHVIFGFFMGLDPAMENRTYIAFVLSLPLSIFFNIRNPHTALLFNEQKTGVAYYATLTRVIMTLTIAYLFVCIGLVGLLWAMIAQTIPVITEAFLMKYFARESLKRIMQIEGTAPKLPEMMLFTMSFSVGKLFICFSGYIIGAFAARAPQQEIMLPVYYAVLGIVNPVSFAAARMQELVISFGKERGKNRNLLLFMILLGIILGIIPLLFLCPPLNKWYYTVLQRLPADSMRHIKLTGIFLGGLPLFVAFRAYAEGWAAHHKKPVSVVAGQGVYLGMVVTAAFFALNSGLPGSLIGPVALYAGNIFSMIVISLSLNIETKSEYPVSETSTPYSLK